MPGIRRPGTDALAVGISNTLKPEWTSFTVGAVSANNPKKTCLRVKKEQI